ncbi:helix-turn-helix domain-containing protein [Gemmiger formicilis]
MAIEHARNDKGLTREDPAERIRKSERYVVAIERGERTPSLKTC